MFCYQCQEAAQNVGCTVKGVCGKTPEVAGLQDLLVYQLKGLSVLTKALRTQGVEVSYANRFIVDGLFMTITNANFDYDRFVSTVRKGFDLREKLEARLAQLNVALPQSNTDILTWTAATAEEMEAKAAEVSVLATENEDVRSLRELVIYGLKGMAAYCEHAFNLNFEDAGVYAFMQDALVATTDDSLNAEQLTALVL